MSQLVPLAAHACPVLIAAAGDQARLRFIEFFTANIRNRNTRRAYAQAVSEFLAWCEDHRVPSITAVQPVHVAGYIEELMRLMTLSARAGFCSAIVSPGGSLLPIGLTVPAFCLAPPVPACGPSCT
jgi:hypothetical protein